MLMVKRLTSPDEARRPLADQVLISEEVLVRVTRTGFSLSYLPTGSSSWQVFPPDLRADPSTLLADGRGAIFGAFVDDVFTGSAAVIPTDSGWAELLDLRVDASLRRQGVGTLLLDTCIDYAARRGMHGIRIVTSDANPVLCQFCEKRGFQLGGMDRLALTMTPAERFKPVLRRACALMFYRMNEKG